MYICLYIYILLHIDRSGPILHIDTIAPISYIQRLDLFICKPSMRRYVYNSMRRYVYNSMRRYVYNSIYTEYLALS